METAIAAPSRPISPPRPVPAQHGAWGTLLTSFVLGTAAGGRFGASSAILLAGALATFFARHTLGTRLKLRATDARRAALGWWSILYALLAAGAGAILLIRHGAMPLLPLGAAAAAAMAAHLELSRRRQEYSLLAEGIGMAGLSLLAPAAEYVAVGSWTSRTAALGVTCAVYFIGGIFRVRYLVRNRAASAGPLTERFRAGTGVLVFHLLAIPAILEWLILARWIAPPAAAAFAPVSLYAMGLVLWRFPSPVVPKRIGWWEVANSAVFAAMTVWMLRG